MDKIIKIAYLGFSNKCIEYINEKKEFCLECCICEEKRVTDELKKICEIKNLKLYTIHNNNDLKNILMECNIECVIMYECGLIISQNILDIMDFYNIHGGDLRYNRGANPIIWSILNRDRYSEITIYKVTSKIDMGEIISEYPVIIEESDGSKTLKDKLENGIPYLLDNLYSYLLNGEKKFDEGLYNRKIVSSDYMLNLNKDSIETILSKIRSQELYGGVKYKDKYITDIAVVNRNNSFNEKDDCVEFETYVKVKLYFK